MVGVVYVYVDAVFGFYGLFCVFFCCFCFCLFLFFFNCLVGCFSMIVWTPAVLSVLYACVSYVCICPHSAQLSMFHMERRSRNIFIIIILLLF